MPHLNPRPLALLAIFSPILLHAVTVSVQVIDARCGLPNGGIVATANGGLPPYSFSWSNGASGSVISGLLPGTYTVTVTDGLSNTDQATATVVNIQELFSPFSSEVRSGCAGACTGWASISEVGLGGTPPYSYDWPNPSIEFGQVTFMGVCPWLPNPVTVSDAMGCTGSFELFVMDGPQGQPQVIDDSPACGAQANGSITIANSGGDAYFQVTPLGGGAAQYFEFFSTPWTITGLAAGDYEVMYWDPFGVPPLFVPGPVYCTGPSLFTIGSLPEPCGSLTGTVFHDADQDCVFNGSDLKQPFRVITIDPIGAYAIGDGQGQYQQNVNYGAYGLSQDLTVSETQICPAASPQVVTVDAITPDVNTDFANLSTVPHDLVVHIWSNAARPGFPTRVHLSVVNPTAFPSGNASVDLNFDPLLLNASPSNGHWDLGVLAPYASEHLHFDAEVPANINLLGTVMNYTATLSNAASESSLANNTASLDVTITGSYDPNDKQGNTSSGLSPMQYFLAQDEWIDYTVRFQNTGTAAAETVVIRDTIDTDLSIPSLEILGASHDFAPSFGFGNARELVFTFADINLPDSTSDPLGSQGFISYRIKPNNNIAVGTLLENTAGIYFDFNPPIITNTVNHVVDFSTSIPQQAHSELLIHPNPASDRITIVAEAGIAAITILAADGRMVLPTTSANSMSIDVSALASGPYLLLAELKNGSIAREHFVKH